MALMEHMAVQLGGEPTGLAPARRTFHTARHMTLLTAQLLLCPLVSSDNNVGCLVISASLVTAKDSKPTSMPTTESWTGKGSASTMQEKRGIPLATFVFKVSVLTSPRARILAAIHDVVVRLISFERPTQNRP